MLLNTDNTSIGILFLRPTIVMIRKIQMNGAEDSVALLKNWENHTKEALAASEVVHQ